MSKTTRRSTVARHGQLRSPSAWGQLLKMVGVGALVLLVSGVGVGAYIYHDFSSSITANAVEVTGQETVPPDLGAIEGGVNMLLVGTDECPQEYAADFEERCDPDSDEASGAALNDVNMLLHISDEPRRVTVITFPRDLMVEIPECTDGDGNTTSAMWKQQINVAWPTGGLDCVTKTISELSGQDIHFSAKVNWGGVIDMTNAIGGVSVCVANGLKDDNTGLDLPPGTHNLHGHYALQFLRTRYGVGDGSDLGRISNQQVYLSALARKLVSEEVLTNPATLLNLANVAMNSIVPSQNLTNPMTLVQIALAVKSVAFEDINFVQYPNVTDPDNPAKVIPNEEAAEELWAVLAANQPFQVTGTNDGAVLAVPDEQPVEGEAPVEGEVPAEGEVPTDETGVTADGKTLLPTSIVGQSAADQTCSNGNGYYTGPDE